MPKLFVAFLISVSYFLSSATLCVATTDPIPATSSATATVPATTPTTSDVTAPSVPILINPIDGTITDNSSPEFVWRQSMDPNGNTVFYTLYLNEVATYLNISSLGNSVGINYSTRLENNIIYLTPIYALADGSYSWYVTASDLAGNTSHSATWHITLQSYFALYPATISRISSPLLNLSSLLYVLLSLAIPILLIFLWRRRYNLILLDSRFRPIHPATIYHSRSQHSRSEGLPHSGSVIFHPSSYKSYIPHLSRYSTLTIRIQGNVACTTYILSICAKQRVYTIVLG